MGILCVRTQDEQLNAELGYASMRRLRVSDYVGDLRSAGFAGIVVQDMAGTYQRHLTLLEANARRNGHAEADPWTALSLRIIRDGHKIGARILAGKPDAR